MAEASSIDSTVLKRLIPLNTLSDHGVESLMQHADVFSAKKGTVLFEQGDGEQLHYYLLAGVVQLEVDGKAHDELNAEADTSKFPIAHQFPRKYTARAVTKIRFLRLDSRLLSTMMAKSSGSDYEVSELDAGLETGSDDWMTQLLSSRIFQLIPPGNIQKVMMYMEEFSVKAGDLVIRQGDEGDYFYMINKGRCRVERDMNDGNPPVELAQLGPGAGFAEPSP
jgi:CRP-like cAMP-binding protein